MYRYSMVQKIEVESFERNAFEEDEVISDEELAIYIESGEWQ